LLQFIVASLFLSLHNVTIHFADLFNFILFKILASILLKNCNIHIFTDALCFFSLRFRLSNRKDSFCEIATVIISVSDKQYALILD